MGKFVISKRKNGEFQFNLLAGNGQVIPKGQIIGVSEMYESQTSCTNRVESVKKNAPGATIEDKTK